MITPELCAKIEAHIAKAESGSIVQSMAALMVDLETFGLRYSKCVCFLYGI